MPALTARRSALVAMLALSAPGAAFAQAPGQSFIVDLPSVTAPAVAPCS